MPEGGGAQPKKRPTKATVAATAAVANFAITSSFAFRNELLEHRLAVAVEADVQALLEFLLLQVEEAAHLPTVRLHRCLPLDLHFRNMSCAS
jgi:hypothetical protein